MAHRRRPATALALVCCSVLLAGCAADDSSPISARESGQIVRHLLDEEWTVLSYQYPEAIRPAIPVIDTVSTHDHTTAVSDCLLSRGFVTDRTGNSIQYSSSNGQTPLEYAVAQYYCFSSYPSVEYIQSQLDGAGQAALARYYAGVVRPCLLGLGEPSSPPAATSSLDALGSWNPYDLVWATRLSSSRLSYVETRCPPVPAWLRLDGARE